MRERRSSFPIFCWRWAQFICSRSGELTAEIRGLTWEYTPLARCSRWLVLCDLWREKPEQPTLTGSKIEIDQRHATLRKLQRCTSQGGNGPRKVRFVTNDH